MNSMIFSTAVQALTPLFMAFALFMLLRGHNEPGGGFIGGLLAVTAFALYQLAYGPRATKRLLRQSPRVFIASGLLLAALSGCAAWVTGQPFMQGQWLPWELPAELKVGTVLLFDLGVFFVVLGSVTLMLISLSED